MIKNLDFDFNIVIDFDKESPNPSRVFDSMSLLIKAFEQFDTDLVKHIDNSIDAVLILEDVEKGSLKTVLKNIIKGIPDEPLENGDIRGMIGHYLLKAKYVLLNKLEGKVTLTDAKEIEIIETDLLHAAKETGVDKFSSFVSPSRKVIIKNIDSINKSLEPLGEKDSVTYESSAGDATFNMELTIDYERMEELITNETIESESTLILKVKKPDYLGDSKWGFKHGSATIYASISDKEWLMEFQNRKIDVRPQDSLVCKVKSVVKYDDQYEPISNSFEVTKVVKVNPRPDSGQVTLPLN